MKQLILTLTLLTSISLPGYSQKIERAQKEFVKDFIEAAEIHDQDAVLAMVDQEYRDWQLDFIDRELSGGVSRFLDELFWTPFNTITKIRVKSIKAFGNDGDVVIYEFEVTSPEGKVNKTLYLSKKNGVFGFIGASG